jgi:hypothetical protein
MVLANYARYTKSVRQKPRFGLNSTDCASMMTSEVPISHHLDLYRHWFDKASGRVMPAHGDIDPVDIPKVLPHIALVDEPDGKYRFRLVGTNIVEMIGRDLTGAPIDSHAGHAGAPLEGVAERVFTTARPVFVTGFFKTGLGAIQNVSALFLPLSDDGMHVNMIVGTRVACLNAPAAGLNWNGAHLKIGEMIDVDGPADLEKCCLLWESRLFGGSQGE